MKIATDIKQSKKLAEIGIDTETADMFYATYGGDGRYGRLFVKDDCIIGGNTEIPAWSLSALLGIIKDTCGYYELVFLKSTFDSRGNRLENVHRLSTDMCYDVYEREIIDACYEMIVILHEKGLL